MYKINKKVRLIELFAGIGSQAMALKELGVDFESYRVVEFDKYAIKSYNAIHGTNFDVQDITKTKGKDLGVVDTDKYEYIMVYSFPCQDLSVAGTGAGMDKGKGTRSGLLWEVERLLDELDEDPNSELPQVLLMENVIQVHGKKQIKNGNWQSWLDFLASKGYQNFYKDMNSKDYGVPQNRNRCFMISILNASESDYRFPDSFELNKVMKDYLDQDVEEKFYINNDRAHQLIEKLLDNGTIPDPNSEEAKQFEIS